MNQNISLNKLYCLFHVKVIFASCFGFINKKNNNFSDFMHLTKNNLFFLVPLTFLLSFIMKKKKTFEKQRKLMRDVKLMK